MQQADDKQIRPSDLCGGKSRRVYVITSCAFRVQSEKFPISGPVTDSSALSSVK